MYASYRHYKAYGMRHRAVSQCYCVINAKAACPLSGIENAPVVVARPHICDWNINFAPPPRRNGNKRSNAVAIYFFDDLYDVGKFMISVEVSHKSTNTAWAVTHRRLCLFDTPFCMHWAFCNIRLRRELRTDIYIIYPTCLRVFELFANHCNTCTHTRIF